MVISLLSVVQPGVESSGVITKLGATTRLPLSAHAAAICSSVAGVLARRKRETAGVGMDKLDVEASDVDRVAVGRSTVGKVKTIEPVPNGKVRLLVGDAASDVRHVEGPIGIVSIMVVVMIETLVRTENSVAVGQASEAVLLIRVVELLVGNTGTVLFNDTVGVADGTEVRFPIGNEAEEVMFDDALCVADGTEVRFPIGNEAEEVMFAGALGVGRIVEIFPTENEDTVV
jgi:hypothetical protein